MLRVIIILEILASTQFPIAFSFLCSLCPSKYHRRYITCGYLQSPGSQVWAIYLLNEIWLRINNVCSCHSVNKYSICINCVIQQMNHVIRCANHYLALTWVSSWWEMLHSHMCKQKKLLRKFRCWSGVSLEFSTCFGCMSLGNSLWEIRISYFHTTRDCVSRDSGMKFSQLWIHTFIHGKTHSNIYARHYLQKEMDWDKTGPLH